MKNLAPPYTAAEPDEALKKVRKHNSRRGKGKKANEEKSSALLREMSARKGKKKY